MQTHPERRGSGHPNPTIRHYRYQVYGLVVESEIELPELVTASGGMPEVSIRFGHVPAQLEGAIGDWSWCAASRSEFVFTIDGVARYHVAQGKEIIVERRMGLDSAVPPADLRLWLLGSAFGALLHQRGLLPLHVSAVKAPSGVWAFTGESGEGKSTLAGFLHRRHGWELVSDDVSAVEQSADAPVIHPGPRKLKLWADALSHLELEEYESVRDLSNTDKFQLYLTDDRFYRAERLTALVILESAEADGAAEIEALKGVQAFNACVSAVYRPYMESWFKLPAQRLNDLAQLCRTTRVVRFRRPRSLRDFESNLKPLIDLMTGVDR